MAATKLVNDMLAAGFSWDEIKGDASTSYREMLSAGFTQEEVDKDVFDRYGFRFSYDPNLEDDLVLMEDIASSPAPEKAQQQLVDAEVDMLAEREVIAQARKNADFDRQMRQPYHDSYTPEQHAQVEKERENLPFFRNYSDTELMSQALYEGRDSVFTRASERGELSWRDRSFQDDLVKQGVLKAPEPPKPPKQETVIRATTPAEIEHARQNPMPYMRKAETLADFASYGFRHSTTSLFFAAPPKDMYLPDNIPFAGQAAMGLAQGVGDLPTTVAGGLAGAAATVETGPGMVAGAFAGAMALNEGARSSMLLGYQRGAIDSIDEFLYRTKEVGIATGKGAATGFITGYTGGLAQASSPFIAQGLKGTAGAVLRASAQPATEVATMTAVNAAMEGRLPTMNDLALNGVMVGGYRLGGFYTNKLAYGFQKTGMAPESLIQYAKETPGAKEDLLSGNIALPQEMGGNFQPLYSIKRNQPLDKQGSQGEWFHLSQNTAAKVTEGINKKNGVSADGAPEGYAVHNMAIPAETNLLWIRSRSDPNKARLFKQFMREQDPEIKFGEQSAINKDATAMFENPTQAFIEFLQSGRGRMGPKEDTPVTGVQGLRIGDKAMIFDKNAILSGDVLRTVAKSMEVAAADIQKSVSVNEAAVAPKSQVLYNTYQDMVDMFQPLNKNADPGRVTVPYMAARLFMGIYGLVSHWLTIGRTAYTRPSILREAGFERPVAGKSLQDIFAMGASRPRLQLKPAARSHALSRVASKESGADGSMAIGYDKTGGTSYGKFQISSRTFPQWIKWLDSNRHKAVAQQLRAAGAADTGSKTGAMPSTWKKLVKQGSITDTMQEAFIHDSHIAPALKGLPSRVKQVIEQDPGLYQLLLSTAVQHGPGKNGARGIIANAWRKSGGDRNAFIDAIIAERKTRFGSSTPEVQAGVAKRLDAERAEAKSASDMSLSSAMEKVGVRIKEASVESNKDMLQALEAMRQNNEIAPTMYEKAKAQILESTDALTNRSDPLNLFRTYVIAKHVNELAANGINAGVDVAAAKAIARNPALVERFEPAAKELYAYQRALLDYRYRAGLMSKKTYDKMVLQYPEYIPLNRVMEEGSSVASTGTFAIKGSSRDIIDPFESIIRQTLHTVRESERNSVLQLIAKEFGQTPKAKGSQVTRIGSLSELRAAEAEGRGAGSMETISYRVAGKEKRVEVPRDIYRTAQYLDPVSANAHNGLVKAAAKTAGVLRAGAILHPNFGARNFFRDQFSAYINSDSGYKLFYDFGRGLQSVLSPKTGKSLFPKAQEYYSEWLRHGGSNANLVSQDRTFTQDIIRTLLRTNNVQNSVPFELRAIDGVRHYINPLNWGKKGYRALQAVSEASEEGTRIGEYIRAREQGMNPMEAAYRSREVTMDFARMGASMKAFNSMSVFLNAKVQGADRSIRQLRAHPLRTTNRIIGGIVLPSMLLAMVQQDIIHNSPDSVTAQALKEIPDWQKNTFWIVPSEVGIFRIPIPHEYGIPFANPVRSFIEYMYQNDPDKNFLQKLYDEKYFGQVAEQYFLDGKTLIGSIVPSAVQPFAEVAMNYSLFTGMPVIPPVMESQLPESRYNRNTSELAKSISRTLSQISPLLDTNISQRLISPPSIDYLIAGYGGTLGKDLWSLLDSMAQKWGIVDKVNRPEKQLEDLPLIGAFMVKYPNAGSKSLNGFFDKVERYEQTLASIKALMEEGTATSVQRAEYLLMNAEYGRFTSLRGALADMSGAIRTIHFAPSPETDPQAGISPEDKRHQIDAIYLDMITMAKGGLEVMREIERTNKVMRKEQ